MIFRGIKEGGISLKRILMVLGVIKNMSNSEVRINEWINE